MSNTDFADFRLSGGILRSLEKMGYKQPTQVQRQVIPLALGDRDVIVRSRTGSGKTASFAIPLCEKTNIDTRGGGPQALVLTPTRELSVQVKEEISSIGRHKRIRCAAVFGKQPFSGQANELRQRVHIVVGTPGRVMDHIKRGTLAVDSIKYLIIDEADKMLDMGFISQVEDIINRLNKNRVTMLFSATIHGEVEALCSSYMINPVMVETAADNIVAGNIEQQLYRVEDSMKPELLEKLIYIENPGSCIIFCRTKENVEYVAGFMKGRGFSCRYLHGGMLQADRLETMEGFKRGEFKYLVATDVAARGIDVEDITHIINYDMPVENESYVHRIGRTGRGGKSGRAITFSSPNEDRYLQGIQDYIGCSIPVRDIPSDRQAECAKAEYEKASGSKPVPKSVRGAELNRDIQKIYINAGRKKKVRPGDIVGAITNISGINAEDVGIIDIQDNFSYIDILNGKGEAVLDGLQHTTVKGKAVRAQKAVK